MVAVGYESGRLRELCITMFKSQFKQGFVKVVVTRAGRLQEWSQGELDCSYLRGSLVNGGRPSLPPLTMFRSKKSLELMNSFMASDEGSGVSEFFTVSFKCFSWEFCSQSSQSTTNRMHS